VARQGLAGRCWAGRGDTTPGASKPPGAAHPLDTPPKTCEGSRRVVKSTDRENFGAPPIPDCKGRHSSPKTAQPGRSGAMPIRNRRPLFSQVRRSHLFTT
jgi:hypothetical protein